jgi:diguanylate cyclase (GGDEF)-like protein/putative nucleotidyltransferase with HDIG domain
VHSSSDGSAHARPPHLRLVDAEGADAPARALIEEGRTLDKLGKRADARVLYERALHGLERSSASMASMLLRWIASTYEVDADYQAAADCAEAAVATAELGDDRNALGHALNVLGAARWREGDLEVAQEIFQDALQRGTSATDPRLHVDVTTNLGSLAKIRGDFREALRYYQDALAHGRRHSLLDNIVGTLNNLGIANLELGRLDAAEDAFTEALTIANALGGLSLRIELEVNFSMLSIERRDYEEAKRRCDRAMALAGHLGDSRANAEAEKVYGIIARETGDLVEAEQHLQRARAMGAAVRDLTLEGDASRELAELYARLGRNRETLQALNRAHVCFTMLRARHELADVGRRMARLEGDFLEVVRRWGESIESKDVLTQGHCERVADLAGALAAKAGLDDTSLFWFRIGALLHDVGKLIIPADVLNRPGHLTDEEWALMRQHPEAGERMLADVQFPWDVAPMVRSHHERWDGKGYPDGLAGEAIPLAARILSVADVYDALTTERSYKRAFSHLEAMEIMRREVGRQYDPELFVKFEELVRRGAVKTPPAAQRAMPSRRVGAGGAVTVSEEDDLTGALVRRAFVNVTAAVLAERRRTGAQVSLFVVDVDQFKSVNDTYGHLTGDDALRLVAGVIREHLRPGQYVGRYAGDEFVVLLPGFDAEAAREFAEEVRRTTSATAIPLREPTGQAMAVTLSIGVSTAPLHGETFEALFTSADRALFEAKRAGRDTVVVASTGNEGPPQLAFSRFVGRVNELRALVSALDDSGRVGPQGRLVIGEAGVGKSTLVRQLLPEVRLRGAAMVTGRALESESRPPYGPWAELVLSLHASGLAPTRRWPLLERLVPALSGAVDAARIPTLDPSHGHLLLQELVSFLRAASEARPLILVLEDMHWADTASWDALEYVLSQLATERVFIAITLRSEEAAYGVVRERRRRLSRDERVRELQLARLTVDEVREWLQAALHRTELGDDLLEFVLRHTEGNPFLVMQLLRTMVEEQVFSYSGTAWVWEIPSSLVLPAGMSDLVGRRLSRLPNDAMRVLVTAAAIGRTFRLDLLAAAAGVTMDQVLDAVDSGLASSVLEPAQDQDDDTYQFAHALLMDAMMRSVSPARQRLIHRRIADLLAVRAPQAVDKVASHYALSGDAAQAYTWCRSAAARALSLYALDEATDFLRLALAHASAEEQRIAAYDELARAAELAGRWADVERWCDAMLTSPALVNEFSRSVPAQQRRLQARVRLGLGARETELECRELLAVAERLGSCADVVQIRSVLVQALTRMGQTDDAIRIAEQSVQLADACGDEVLAGEATLRLAVTLNNVRPAAAVELLLRLIAGARSRRDRALEARALLSLGVARTRTRDERSGAEAFRAALAVAREAHALDVAANASMNLGVSDLRRGDFVAAHDACQDALRLYTTLRSNTNRLVALYNLANLERERGDAEAALTIYQETAALAEQLEATDIAIGAHAGVGIAALRLHRLSLARAALADAERTLGNRTDWWFQGRELLESLEVRLAAMDGDVAGARRRFHAAVARLELLEVYPAAWMVADCAADLAEENEGVWKVVNRFAAHPAVQDYVPLAARFTALKDLFDRPSSGRSSGPFRLVSIIDTPDIDASGFVSS